MMKYLPKYHPQYYTVFSMTDHKFRLILSQEAVQIVARKKQMSS